VPKVLAFRCKRQRGPAEGLRPTAIDSCNARLGGSRKLASDSQLDPPNRRRECWVLQELHRGGECNFTFEARIGGHFERISLATEAEETDAVRAMATGHATRLETCVAVSGKVVDVRDVVVQVHEQRGELIAMPKSKRAKPPATCRPKAEQKLGIITSKKAAEQVFAVQLGPPGRLDVSAQGTSVELQAATRGWAARRMSSPLMFRDCRRDECILVQNEASVVTFEQCGATHDLRVR